LCVPQTGNPGISFARYWNIVARLFGLASILQWSCLPHLHDYQDSACVPSWIHWALGLQVMEKDSYQAAMSCLIVLAAYGRV